jgi:hypothetical protein
VNLDGDTGDVDLCRGNDLDHTDLRQVVVGQDHDIAVSIVPANAPDVPAPHHIIVVDQQHERGHFTSELATHESGERPGRCTHARG